MKRVVCSLVILVSLAAGFTAGCKNTPQSAIGNTPEDRKSFMGDPSKMPASIREANEKAAMSAAAGGMAKSKTPK